VGRRKEMLKADYQIIAKTYDNNKDRHIIPKDEIIENFKSSKIRILDLGCGTGNYLQKQQEFYPELKIEWFGVDLSPDMLEIAKSKTNNVRYINLNAESMSFESNYFDYIVCNFAFHQFEKKQLILDLILKYLKRNGIFKYRNICPEIMEGWWVYKYCPETLYEDLNRFWKKDLFVYELEKRNFKTLVNIQYNEDYRDIDTVLTDYKRRDNSQLSIIEDRYYKKGLQYLEMQKNQGIQQVRNYFGLIEIVAEKSI
jgi:ubiquinone/menaquinone biosynthesis C-methylase UbiE